MIKVTDPENKHNKCQSCFEPVNCVVKKIKVAYTEEDNSMSLYLCEKCCVHLIWTIRKALSTGETE